MAAFVLLPILAFWAGRQVESPEQAAAAAHSPTPTLLTATVERRELVARLVYRGEVAPAEQVVIGPPASADGALPVITAAPKRGDTVAEGEVAVEVAGQPVLVLEGSVPAYRPLLPGMRGPDVRQLRTALARLGHDTSADPPEVLGAATAAALSRAYAAAGYTAPDVVPLGGIVFVTALPATVVSVPRVGEQLHAAGPDGNTGPSLILASGRLHVRSGVPVPDRGLIDIGTAATIVDERTGVERAARVLDIAPVPAEDAAGRQSHTVIIQPDDELPPDLLGADVRVVIPTARSNGPVLAVPVAAILLDGAGGHYVLVEREGAEVKVPVRVGIDADGSIEVVPRRERALRAGDEVVIGSRR